MLTCVFGCLPIHRCRHGSSLPAILWLSRIALVGWLPWPRIRTPWWHLSSRVVGVGLGHVNWLGVALWWVALSRVARSRGVVWRRLVRTHLWLHQSPGNKIHNEGVSVDVWMSKLKYLTDGTSPLWCHKWWFVTTLSDRRPESFQMTCKKAEGT